MFVLVSRRAHRCQPSGELLKDAGLGAKGVCCQTGHVVRID